MGEENQTNRKRKATDNKRSNDFLFAAQKITSLASNKILEKTLPLNNCDPGVYTVKFENIDELPFVVNNIRLFKVIGN